MILQEIFDKLTVDNLDDCYQELDNNFDWLQKLRGHNLPQKLINKGKVWEQDPTYHAEGNVWIHTKMVIKSLLLDEDYQNSPKEEQFIMFVSCLLHDVSKPETYELHENGSVSNKSHSRIGALESRSILWKMNLDPITREHISNIIKVHQLPFFLTNREESNIKYHIVLNSLCLSNKLLSIVAKADINGRVILPTAPNSKNDALTNIELYREYAIELNCFDNKFKFFNEHSKRQYLIDYENKSPDVELYNTLDDNFFVIIMSGLPASGKSSYIENNLSDLPKIELDALRLELGIKPTDNQGIIKQEALKRAKELLAKKTSFVWDGVNLDYNRRSQLIDLCCSYGAKVKIYFIETSYNNLIKRNNERTTNKVPSDVIDKMISKWDIPTEAECHELLRIVT